MFCIAALSLSETSLFFLRKNLLITSFSQLSRGPTPYPLIRKGGSYQLSSHIPDDWIQYD